jgi:hypothetical protein
MSPPPALLRTCDRTRPSRSTSSTRSCAGISVHRHATIHTSGATLDKGVARLRHLGSTLPAGLVRPIVIIDVTAASALWSPAYDLGASGDALANQAISCSSRSHRLVGDCNTSADYVVVAGHVPAAACGQLPADRSDDRDESCRRDVTKNRWTNRRRRSIPGRAVLSLGPTGRPLRRGAQQRLTTEEGLWDTASYARRLPG